MLTFVEDHGRMQNCEAAGSGDSGLYPGAGAEGGDQRVSGPRRYTQEIRFCDMHHNTSGYSGTSGNSVWVHHNNFYGNALGFTTDVFTAAGHPGFPQDSDLIEHNKFYSNNFNPYAKNSDVEPTIPVPVGTALWIAGGNHNIFRKNRVWNNWRRGVMLFAVPDALVCGPPEHQAGCDPAKVSTSHRNRFYGNIMGRSPAGKRDPNGTDFWWDNWVDNRGNCWHDNIGKNGTKRSVTTSPAERPSLQLRDEPGDGHGRARGRAAHLRGGSRGRYQHRLSLVRAPARAEVARRGSAGVDGGPLRRGSGRVDRADGLPGLRFQQPARGRRRGHHRHPGPAHRLL